ncbi:NADH:flavin oxidoreductase/NADH oxidase [Paenactinomyces guangxiensis]|uniref:NADH:flavin oxidoreductase/NADH oxidase n=1 Tax=Paenactinomyces guangxiensis TaxID=1490290 RepID=A0A7W1WQQ6_9BACL|nr:NADH:flavin oxidoreductase/NADH oxidase [Paenactinomyces guangxiensis]MBA4494320.1 NADH:flavin oxidoreductase/NADH oxidase [Paenactinomyces guangxiensis]MBH8590815.1 NADH:flavin oxidoreductase/NADH oxidase [Paenactinomyces guangxiensis]
MAGIFDPITLGKLEIKNRVVMSPMCQYQAVNRQGKAETWHMVHYVSRAIGGTGLILMEMTNVEPRGRITEKCLGIYDDTHVDAFAPIVEECHKYGAKVGLQIAHAGRKSMLDGQAVAPSAIPFSPQNQVPKELSKTEIETIIEQFGRGAERAVKAGFDTIELHGAHGYLIHQFMSPASNKRNDEYGDPVKFALDVIHIVKQAMPEGMPLIFRVSAVEYSEGGYTFDEMLAHCRLFQAAGVDVFDISTGGDSPARPEVYPGYQVTYAEVYKKELDLPVITVGKLENPHLAEAVIRNGQADLVCIGRGMLRNPYWVKEAAVTLGAELELPGVYNLGYGG